LIEIIGLALVPIFFVIALGYFAGWHRSIDNHHVGELNALVMDFALPASLFVATASTPRLKMPGEENLFLVLGLVMMALYAAWYGLARILGKATQQEAAVQALTVSLPNYAAAGLPIILAVMGPAAAIHVAVSIAAGSILPSPVTLFIQELAQPNEGGSGARRALISRALSRALLKPIVLAPLAGTVVSLSGLQLDALVTTSLQLIAAIAGGPPCVMLPLQWLSDPALRQRSHAGLNKGEASNALRRAVFFHRQGEIRDRTFENQSFRASGLSLITAAIVHWNTVYLDRAVRQLRAQGATVPDDLLAHVAPRGWEHIGLTGDYIWSVPDPTASFRPLRDVWATFPPLAA